MCHWMPFSKERSQRQSHAGGITPGTKTQKLFWIGSFGKTLIVDVLSAADIALHRRQYCTSHAQLSRVHGKSGYIAPPNKVGLQKPRPIGKEFRSSKGVTNASHTLMPSCLCPN